jgi:hypothetical protein
MDFISSLLLSSLQCVIEDASLDFIFSAIAISTIAISTVAINFQLLER